MKGERNAGLGAAVRKRFPDIPAEENFSLARHTTIGCGGLAAAAVSPADGRELSELLGFLEGENIPYFLLGAGANVLPSDAFFDGVIVRLSRLRRIRREGNELIVGAGVTGAALLSAAREAGLTGAEPLAGIPMTAGGGTAMNAGIPERHFADLAVGVIGAEGGRLRAFSPAECRFSEKDSVFLHGPAVAAVRLSFAEASREAILQRENTYRRKRNALPKGRSMGCVFVNPPDCPAGALIEACGLKGTVIGGARVSNRHANFILNEGGTAEDVARLIALVRERVFGQTGVLLREEIRRIPAT